MASTLPILLIFELRRLGDGVLCLPFIRGASSSYNVYVICTPQVVTVFKGTVDEDHIITWDPPWLQETTTSKMRALLHSGLSAFVKTLRDLHPDVAICAWADPRTQILMALSRAQLRIGFPINATNLLASHLAWRKRQISFGKAMTKMSNLFFKDRLLSKQLTRTPKQHHLDDWRQIASELNLELNLSTPWITSTEKASGINESVDTLLSYAKTSGLPIWLVHSGARQPCRRWPKSHFQAIIHDTLEPLNIPVIIVQPPHEDAPCAAGPHQIVVDSLSINDLIVLMTQADLVLCNDSLALHVASALGKRVVSLFASGSSDWFAPIGNLDLVVQTHVCPDRPCVDRCTQPSYICLKAITVDAVASQVVRATQEFLSKSEEKQAE